MAKFIIETADDKDVSGARRHDARDYAHSGGARFRNADRPGLSNLPKNPRHRLRLGGNRLPSL